MLEIIRDQGHTLGYRVRRDQEIHIADRLAGTLQLRADPCIVACDFLGPVEDRKSFQVRLDQLNEFRPTGFLCAKAQLRRGHHGHVQGFGVFLEFFYQCRWSALDDVAGDIRIQHEPRHNGSRDCGGESLRFSRKSSGTSTCSAKNDAQLGLTGEMNNPSPCLRIRTSLTSAGKRNSCGSRTAWLAPLRNIDARLATALDMDLAADFGITDLPFPLRTRFITYPSGGNPSSICVAYAKIKIPLSDDPLGLESLDALPLEA